MDAEPPARPFAHHVAGVPSGLTDAERSLLVYLAIRTVAAQTGGDMQAAADALDHFAAIGESHITGDRLDVYLVVAGNVLVHAERAWLRAMSQSGNPRNN